MSPAARLTNKAGICSRLAALSSGSVCLPGLWLEMVQEVGGSLRVGGGGEDQALVVLEGFGQLAI